MNKFWHSSILQLICSTGKMLLKNIGPIIVSPVIPAHNFFLDLTMLLSYPMWICFCKILTILAIYLIKGHILPVAISVNRFVLISIFCIHFLIRFRLQNKRPYKTLDGNRRQRNIQTHILKILRNNQWEKEKTGKRECVNSAYW